MRIAVDLGITSIRFPGGQPVLRPGLVEIILATAALPNRPHLTMTTNGIGLASMVADLLAAGLDRVNVSLDTLSRETFQKISHRDRLDDVLAGPDGAAVAGLLPVKVNTVLLRRVNDGEAISLLDFCLSKGFDLRFIEQMPLDPQQGRKRDEMVTADEILELLRSNRRIEPEPNELRGSAPAEMFLVDGGPARVGVIASVTRPFCADCDRVRLTADGAIRTCLFARQETELRDFMRSGGDDPGLAALFRRSTLGTKRGHDIGEPDFAQPTRPMSAIGG